MDNYNVLNFGAKPDGKSDSTQAFHKAWGSACNSTQTATIYVPRGRFLLKNVVFRGLCKSRIEFWIDGTLVAPSDYRVIGDSSGYWILFVEVNCVSVIGGTLDAKGGAFWACLTSGKNCLVGARKNKCSKMQRFITEDGVRKSEFKSKWEASLFIDVKVAAGFELNSSVRL
ncbi:unnamed protein product [Camellia sinensis]